MGKKPRRIYGTPPSEPYDGIILRAQKKEGSLVLTVFTRQHGLCRVYVSRVGKALKNGMGQLQPFGEITFDGWQRQGALYLQEYESKGGALLHGLSLERFTYAAVFVEMVTVLFPLQEADGAAYTLIRDYGRLLPVKDGRIVTIIAGWHLIRQAGFCPDIEQVQLYTGRDTVQKKTIYYLADDVVPDGMTPVSLSPSLRELWQRIMNYSWNPEETMSLSRQGMTVLEQLLYAYIYQCTETPIKTVDMVQLLKET